MTAIDEIKARIDIVDLVSETVDLRRSGRNYIGFCPFHSNTRTPAFAVWPESGTWRCFGECNDGGDIFKFVMNKEGWDFPEALRFLADRAGVVLTPPSPQQQEQVEENERLRSLLEEAVIFYRHNLFNTDAGKIGLNYLKDRKVNDETIEIFGLGYAPNSWDAVSEHFKSKGYSERELIDAGLVSERDSGGIYDRFRGRVVFPIRDERERIAGFGARTLDPEGLPKYLNSPQTSIFDKGKILFGLDRARYSIRSLDQVVIVEGYMGVISPHQHGFTNVVATMGTALTEDHLLLIKRFTRRIVLAMDSDAAGANAALRGLEIARQTLDREGEVLFDAYGLLRWEGRLKADIRVSTLPPGMDPDDVVNQNPKDWEALIVEAKPVVEHVMTVLVQNRDLGYPKVKTEIANQILPLISDIPSAIERDTYRQKLARLLRVDERTLIGLAQYHPRQPRQRLRPKSNLNQDKVEIIPQKIRADQKREAHILGVLVRRPDLIYLIDRHLQEAGLDRISELDFDEAEHQELIHLLRRSLGQNDIEPLDYVLNHLSEPMMNLTDVILEQTEDLDPNQDHVLEDILRALIMVRENKVSQQFEYLRFLQEIAQEQGDLKASEYQDTILNYTVLRSRLHKARSRYTDRSSLNTKG